MMKDLSLVVYLALFISAVLSVTNVFLDDSETISQINTAQVILGFVVLIFVLFKGKNLSTKLSLIYSVGFVLYFLSNLYKWFDVETLTSKSFELLQLVGIYLLFTLVNKTEGFLPLESYLGMLKGLNFVGDNVVRNVFKLGVKK